VYSNARYLNPAQGQFITEDPVFWSLKQTLSNPQSLNSYSYALDNPIVNKDPSGLITQAQQHLQF
jgi:RHS repeat-associated protein